MKKKCEREERYERKKEIRKRRKWSLDVKEMFEVVTEKKNVEKSVKEKKHEE